MSDSDLEKRLSDAIEQWKEAVQTIKYCSYALGLLNRSSLWLTEGDRQWLADIDKTFQERETK